MVGKAQGTFWVGDVFLVSRWFSYMHLSKLIKLFVYDLDISLCVDYACLKEKKTYTGKKNTGERGKIKKREMIS